MELRDGVEPPMSGLQPDALPDLANEANGRASGNRTHIISVKTNFPDL